jgi:hypothetical protein
MNEAPPPGRTRLPLLLAGVVGLGVLALAAALALFLPRSAAPDAPLTRTDADRALAAGLERDVRVLADSIGERHLFASDRLDAAARFLAEELREVGLDPAHQEYEVQGVRVRNVEVEIPGEAGDEIVLIGAHYDSVVGSPGANDNGSGVAAVLALARTFADRTPARTLRFVFFVNEEAPYFQTGAMGSLVYARRSAEQGEDIQGMMSVETIGYYDDAPGSQSYPIPSLERLYPDRGDFLAFVSNLRSVFLMREALGAFRETGGVPSQGAALPGVIAGVGWSDHWAFWQEGYHAFMVTDTAPFRYPYYHTPEDTPDKLDYERMALVVRGLEAVVARLAGA